MTQRVCVHLDEDAAELLKQLAPSPRKQGEYLSGLIREAAARPAAGGGDLEALRLQVHGLVSEIHKINARLLTLESQDE